VADNILATKARKRITTKESTLGERAAATVVWAAIKAKTKIGMSLKTKKKKKVKRILPSKTRCYSTNPTVVEDSRFIDRRSDGSRKSDE